MESDPIKSALQEISEKFNDYTTDLTEKGVYFPRYWLHDQPTIERLNYECIALVKKYMNAREICIGPVEGCISIYNAPLDILPFIPMAFPEISDYGTYDVMRGAKRLGRVTYEGPPKQGESGTIIVGVKTNFVPEEKMAHISFTLVWGDESGQMSEKFLRDMREDKK